MARRRFFVDAVRGGQAELRGDDARHLTRVLRVEPGRCYEISDGQSVYLAEIEEARGERVVFRVVESVAATELPIAITLYAALIKFDRFEWMIEKTTELGVGRIQPVLATRSEKGLFESSAKRSARWNRIARESSQQSRRLRAPEILAAIRFEAALQQAADFRYFLDEDTAPPLLRVLPEHRTDPSHDREGVGFHKGTKPRGEGPSAALLVGPEGGWTDEERASAARANWQPVSLGPQVLRAETAAAAAVAIVVNAWSP
jgi:16S rRNA (uracil1498-N3)-methyltransferase